MFRCTRKLEALIIDIDSFQDFSASEWAEITNKYICIYFSEKSYSLSKLKSFIPFAQTYQMKNRLFKPNRIFIKNIASLIQIKPSNIAFVSADYKFLSRALPYFCGTIWMTSHCDILYEEASVCPDLIVNTTSQLEVLLSSDCCGFCGEAYSEAINTKCRIKTIRISTEMSVNKKSFHVYSGGRYYSTKNFGGVFHSYSNRILLNKSQGMAYNTQNQKFTKIYINIIDKLLKEGETFDFVCSVPPRLSDDKESRFKGIIDSLIAKYGIQDCRKRIKCIKDYTSQKQSSFDRRWENVKDAFECIGDFSNTNILLIDDVISTGATISACVNEFLKMKAKSVSVIVLGVNQRNENSMTEPPKVKCKNCGSEMRLFVNSGTNIQFYSCSSDCCKCTLSYDAGRNQIFDRIDEKIMKEKGNLSNDDSE